MSIFAARLNQQEVVEVYSQTAPIYDMWGMLTEAKARNRALALAHIQNGESVLEVATGTGLTFQRILNANPDGYNVGIDLTPAMLQKAKEKAAATKAHHYELLVGNAYSLQFADHHFDLLMNNYMFDLLPEQDFGRVLAEFKRVLKPNGRLVLVNMTTGAAFYQHFWETLYRVNPRWLGGCRGVLLSEPLQAAGFSAIHRECVSQLGFPSEIISAHA